MPLLVFAGVLAVASIVGIRRGHKPATNDRRWSIGNMMGDKRDER